MVFQDFVLYLFYVLCISSDCTLMLGIVDLCWLGFVGKVRPAGLEGKAGLHTVGSTGQTRFPDLRDELLSSTARLKN